MNQTHSERIDHSLLHVYMAWVGRFSTTQQNNEVKPINYVIGSVFEGPRSNKEFVTLKDPSEFFAAAF